MADKQIYGAADGSTSSAGSQIRTDYFHKKALVEAAKEAYFGQMANVLAMPKNMGKNIKQYHYLPILDDRNQNDQGIDAAGAVTSAGAGYTAYISALVAGGAASQTLYFRGDSTTSAAAALLEAKANFNAWAVSQNYAGALITDVAADPAASYAELDTAIGSDYTLTVIAATTDNPYGNLYGSSKDIGTITSKIPALSENGGRVNRVGMKRIELSAQLEKFGFFDEYTQESLNFDSDAELYMHMSQEMVKAANEITEDQLQMDLLNAAGVLRYTGDATSAVTLAGAATLGAADVITYDDLVKLGIELDQNRCPKNTKLITGSRMVDTKTVNAARYIYIGSELVPSIMRLTDYHSSKAFIPVAQYASAGNVARGEIGAIDNFRFIVVPEMMFWEGAGADVTDALEETSLFRYGAVSGATGDGASLSYNVYPMLVVGEGSFTTVGFQTDGKTVKFKIKNVKPEQNYSSDDPFGETGFTSIKWYYASMILRPERIALVKTIAEW